MARSLDKKKPNTSMFEYGEKPVNFYQNAAVRNDLINQTLINQINHTYFHPSEKVSYKKSSKAGKKTINNRMLDGPQNVY